MPRKMPRAARSSIPMTLLEAVSSHFNRGKGEDGGVTTQPKV